MNDPLSPLDLGDRLLWADGVSSVTPKKLPDALLQLAGKNKLAVTELNEEIRAYNAVAEHPLQVKTELDLTGFPPKWVLPGKYQTLDLDEYLMGLVNLVAEDNLYEKRLERLAQEISLFKSQNLDNILRALLFVIETMKDKKVIWGVGRGSSCSSYLLYLMGLHEVDPVLYEIDIEDFLRPV